MSTSSHSSNASDAADVEIEVFVGQLDDIWAKIEDIEKKHKAEVMRLQARIIILEASLDQALKRLQEISYENDHLPEIGVRSSRLWRELEGCRVKVFVGAADEAAAAKEKKEDIEVRLKAPGVVDRGAPGQDAAENNSDTKESLRDDAEQGIGV